MFTRVCKAETVAEGGMRLVIADNHLIVLAWPGMISDRAAWWIVFFLPALYFLIDCRQRVLGNSGRPAAHGRDLIPVLRNTGFLELAMGLAYFAAFALA